MVEWNNIEKTIAEYRDDFESDIQNAGHEAKFCEKLDDFHRKQAAKNKLRLFQYAASIASLFIFSLLVIWFNYYLNNKHEVKFAFNDTAIEFNEASKYYANQINSGLEQIKKLPFTEPHQIDSIFAELTYMDVNKKQLLDELSQNPDDERVMGAIINVYIVKMDAINQVLQSFSISQSNKTNSHEKNI